MGTRLTSSTTLVRSTIRRRRNRETISSNRPLTIIATITPSGAKGSVVTGHLYIDNFNFALAAGDELIDLPYAYTIS